MTEVDPVVADALDAATDGLLSLPQANPLLVELLAGLPQDSYRAEHIDALRAAVCFEPSAEGRFRGFFAGDITRPWPRDPAHIPAGVLSIWLAYAEHARGAAVRAHLQDLLWQAGSAPAYLHARAAISAYRDAVTDFMASSDPVRGRLKAVHSLTRALDLAMAANQPDLREAVAIDMVTAAGALLADKPASFGLILQLLESLRQRHLHPDKVQEMTEQAIDEYPIFIMQIRFMDLQRAAAPDAAARRVVDERIVSAMMAYAETRPGPERLKWLDDAAAMARNCGLSELHQSALLAMQSTPIASMGFGRVRRPVVQVGQDVLEAAVAEIDDAENLASALWAVVKGGPPAGSAPDAEEAARNLIPQFPLAASIAQEAINPAGPVPVAAASDDAAANFSADWQLLALTYSSQVVAAQLDRIKVRFGPSEAELTELFRCAECGSASHLDMLVKAFLSYWDKQDAAAVHLALPRIEALLREIERSRGVPVMAVAKGMKPGGMSQLGTLISGMPAAGFDPDWNRSLDLLLTDGERGLNLRNNVSHGLSDCPPRPLIALVLQAALYLLAVAHGIIPLLNPHALDPSDPSGAASHGNEQPQIA